VEIAKAVNARYLQLMAMREDLASVRVGLSIVRNAW
jgi:mannitol/fructose-specific phosphotransferase system IIA component